MDKHALEIIRLVLVVLTVISGGVWGYVNLLDKLPGKDR